MTPGLISAKDVDETIVKWVLYNCAISNPGVGTLSVREAAERIKMWPNNVRKMINMQEGFKRFSYLAGVREDVQLPEDVKAYVLANKCKELAESRRTLREEFLQQLASAQVEYNAEAARLKKVYDERILYIQEKLASLDEVE